MENTQKHYSERLISCLVDTFGWQASSNTTASTYMERNNKLEQVVLTFDYDEGRQRYFAVEINNTQPGEGESFDMDARILLDRPDLDEHLAFEVIRQIEGMGYSLLFSSDRYIELKAGLEAVGLVMELEEPSAELESILFNPKNGAGVFISQLWEALCQLASGGEDIISETDYALTDLFLPEHVLSSASNVSEDAYYRFSETLKAGIAKQTMVTLTKPSLIAAFPSRRSIFQSLAGDFVAIDLLYGLANGELSDFTATCQKAGIIALHITE